MSHSEIHMFIFMVTDIDDEEEARRFAEKGVKYIGWQVWYGLVMTVGLSACFARKGSGKEAQWNRLRLAQKVQKKKHTGFCNFGGSVPKKGTRFLEQRSGKEAPNGEMYQRQLGHTYSGCMSASMTGDGRLYFTFKNLAGLECQIGIGQYHQILTPK